MGVDQGRLQTLNGRTLRVMFTMNGEHAGDYFGVCNPTTRPSGDVTGDGVPDVGVAAPGFDNASDGNAGKVSSFALDGLALLDASGERVVAESVPSGLSGTSATLRSYAIGFRGRVIASNDETIAFQ